MGPDVILAVVEVAVVELVPASPCSVVLVSRQLRATSWTPGVAATSFKGAGAGARTAPGGRAAASTAPEDDDDDEGTKPQPFQGVQQIRVHPRE